MTSTPGPALPEDPATGRLAECARDGDAASFASLYARVAPALLAWIRLRILPPLRKRLDPEDVLHEVVYRAYVAFRNDDATKGTFRGWLFGIARNVLREALAEVNRRRSGDAGLPSSMMKTPLDELPVDATTVSRRVARDETLSLFLDRLGALPDDEKALLLYRGFEGLSHREVAERLGISVEAAEKRWERLRDRLIGLAPPPDLFA
jgi:RNA polymerase sigma-70 factor (ECF subfamily)